MGICLKKQKVKDQIVVVRGRNTSMYQQNNHSIQLGVGGDRSSINPVNNNPRTSQQSSNQPQFKESASISRNLSFLKKSAQSFRQSTNQNLCDICYCQYHIISKWPMRLCNNEHFICEQCVDDLIRTFGNQPFPCPFCRQLVIKSLIRPYQQLFSEINNLKSIESLIIGEDKDFLLFSFKHELYEIAYAFKNKKQKQIAFIEHLNFNGKRLEEFQYFNKFQRLVYLQLQNNLLSSCIFLGPLKKTVKFLNLSHNQITNIDPINGFASLQILACEYNQISQITFNDTLLSLKQLFIFGNTLNQDTVKGFKQLNFTNLTHLSIQSLSYDVQQLLISKLETNKLINYPRLEKLIVNTHQTQKNFTSKIKVKIIFRNDANEQDLSNYKYLSAHLEQAYTFGNLFQFRPDPFNAHANEYVLTSGCLIKKGSLFSTINSAIYINPKGKSSLRFTISQKYSNLMVGICTESVRHSATVYSDKFIGLTFWGNIYNQAQAIPIQCDLRLEKDSKISTIVDYQKHSITWMIDERKVGQISSLDNFIKNTKIYFVIGIRDQGISIKLLE